MASDQFNLEGARILITGASSGIGHALAIALGKEGSRLALIARRQPLLEDLKETIVAAGGETPLIFCADLSIPGAGREAALKVEAELGGIDVLINNAGVSIIGAQHIIGDSAEARALYETNYWSPLALITALMPGMRQRKQGVVVNVTSTLQNVPMPLIGYYCASKTAFARATQVMRHELQDSGVHVMEVVPGGTDTPTRHQDRNLPLRKNKSLPAPPLVSPHSTAKAVVRGLRQKANRVVYPATSLLPLELPSVGRLIGFIAAGAIDASSEKIVIP